MKVAFKTRELEQLYSTPLNEIRGKQKFSRQVIKQYQAKRLSQKGRRIRVPI